MALASKTYSKQKSISGLLIAGVSHNFSSMMNNFLEETPYFQAKPFTFVNGKEYWMFEVETEKDDTVDCVIADLYAYIMTNYEGLTKPSIASVFTYQII